MSSLVLVSCIAYDITPFSNTQHLLVSIVFTEYLSHKAKQNKTKQSRSNINSARHVPMFPTFRAKRVAQKGLSHGSRAEKLGHHESRIFKFYFQALHVSRETCASRITKNIFITFLGK